MGSHRPDGNGAEATLPPPPASIPHDVFPARVQQEQINEPVEKKVARTPISRRGIGSKGQRITLLTNHFQVNFSKLGGHFFHYNVALSYEDDRPVDQKGVGRKVIAKLFDSYGSEFAGKDFAYDGEKGLLKYSPFPQEKFEFTVVLDEITSNRNDSNSSPDHHGITNDADRKRQRRPYLSKTFKVEISFAAKISTHAITTALKGQESENSQYAMRVLDVILQQDAYEKGCLLVRQSFFRIDPDNCADVGGGVLACRGFHSSFRTTQGGLSLNMDVSTTMIVKPGCVVDFLIANQNESNLFLLDWSKAKRTLKNLRIKARPSNKEFKITGLSEQTCKNQMFTMKLKSGRDVDDVETIEVSVYDYFVKHRKISLSYSRDLPCINVGKPKRPTYIPIELCSLVSLERYTKALTTFQRVSLAEISTQKPQDRMEVLAKSLTGSAYEKNSMLNSCGISINNNFTQVEGRVLPAPRLKVGNGEDFFPRNGRWDFHYKKLFLPAQIDRWAVVNFSARNIDGLLQDLNRCAAKIGIRMEEPSSIIEEDPQSRHASPVVRVERMFDVICSKLPEPRRFLLCLLPERKNCDVYGPWKRKSLADHGIITQCIAPTRVDDQYLTNVLLKINTKLGGLNSLLTAEHAHSILLVSKVPTLIIGMDVSHSSPGQSDVPSIAAVVSSRQWPLISRYRASVRTQSPKVKMIDSLYKRISDSEDDGIFKELLIDFYKSSGKRKPDHIIIFRDGVSESQFNQVLNIELDQMMEACKFHDEKWCPKFVVIAAQKNHHTKFFQTESPDNVPPGTVIDNSICHPRNMDFYMCAHAGMSGTTRPINYHVLHDDVGFGADDLQELVHSLSYVYQRSPTAVSVVAPIRYAHLAASQMGQFMKFEKASETSSSHGGGGLSSAGAVPVLQ